MLTLNKTVPTTNMNRCCLFCGRPLLKTTFIQSNISNKTKPKMIRFIFSNVYLTWNSWNLMGVIVQMVKQWTANTKVPSLNPGGATTRINIEDTDLHQHF